MRCRSQSTTVGDYRQFVDIHPAVRDALQSKGAVVALESTIITHGMPYPHNLETAQQVEDLVRQQVQQTCFVKFIRTRNTDAFSKC